jgi:hypothetical protein
MFRKNESHRQRDMFGRENYGLSEAKYKEALKSREYRFYEEVFCRIDEGIFEPLFAGGWGRPNAPLNSMVAAMILREVRHCTYAELFRSLDFDVLTRMAIGLTDMSETPFCPATLFNFQDRLVHYERGGGPNLFEQLFHSITGDLLERFGVDASIQRCDSFAAMSNIANYGRVRLLVEVLLRLYRVLEASDREKVDSILQPYTSQSSDNYVYRMNPADLPRELAQLSEIYVRVFDLLGDSYAEDPVYRMFKRVMVEQFEIRGDGDVRVRRPKEIGSGSLQSPDDSEATFSMKSGKKQKGYKVNIAETATPKNELNLINDVSVQPNNVHDGTMLAERMDVIKEHTPELNEMHTDGGYGGSVLDPKMSEHKVLHVETGSKMGKARVNMIYYSTDDDGYQVSCPLQTSPAGRTRKRWKADFNNEICGGCPHREQCPTVQHRRKRTLYFDESWAKASIRSRNIELIPEDRRKLRANVEATVDEFTGCFNHKGKLRVRGLARSTLQILAAALAINFGRVFRFRSRNGLPRTPQPNQQDGKLISSSNLPRAVLTSFRAYVTKIRARNRLEPILNCQLHASVPDAACMCTS